MRKANKSLETNLEHTVSRDSLARQRAVKSEQPGRVSAAREQVQNANSLIPKFRSFRLLKQTV